VNAAADLGIDLASSFMVATAGAIPMPALPLVAEPSSSIADITAQTERFCDKRRRAARGSCVDPGAKTMTAVSDLNVKIFADGANVKGRSRCTASRSSKASRPTRR